MSSPPSILFYTHPITPIFYQSATDSYYLCPPCMRPHNTRFCSGRTAMSWELCERHEPGIASHQKILSYDPDDLKYFREALFDGRLRNQFYFKMANPSNGSAQDDTTFRNPSYFRPASNPSIKRSADDKNDSSSESDTKDKDKDIAASGGSAIPVLNGGSSDASSDRTTSESSTTVTDNVRKVLLEGSSGSDQKSRKQSHCHSSTTTHTAEPARRASSPPAPAPYLKPTVTSPTKSQVHTITPPTRLIKYAHDPGAGCIYSSSPSLKVIDHHMIGALNRQKLRHLQYLREQYDASWGTELDLKNLHALILEDLQTSSLAKGLYFKRCNGEYVNALGEVPGLEVIMNWAREELEQVMAEKSKHQEYFKSGKQCYAKPVTTNRDHEHVAHDGRDSGYNSPSLEEENIPPIPPQPEHSADKSGTTTTAFQDPPPSTNKQHHTSPPCRHRSSETNYLNTDEISIPDNLSSPSLSPEHEAQPPNIFHTNGALTLIDPRAPANEAISLQQYKEQYADINKPRIPLAMLLAREQLVKGGQASEEDLIMTCYAMSSQQDCN